MIRRPPVTPLTDPLFPFTTLFRSYSLAFTMPAALPFENRHQRIEAGHLLVAPVAAPADAVALDRDHFPRHQRIIEGEPVAEPVYRLGGDCLVADCARRRTAPCQDKAACHCASACAAPTHRLSPTLRNRATSEISLPLRETVNGPGAGAFC